MENCDDAQKKELEKYIAMPAGERDTKLTELKKAMADAEAMIVADLVTVMTPIRVGSMIMQRKGIRSSASMYLPVYHGVLRQLGPDVTELRLPEGCGPWSGQNGGGTKKAVKDLELLWSKTARVVTH